MSTSRDELAELWRNFGDEELLRRLRSGELTGLASEVATAELRRRGLDPETPEPAAAETTGLEDYADTGALVTVARLLDPVEAQVLQTLLQAEGIPTFIADQQLVQANRLWSIALGGVRLQVPAHLAGQAQAVMTAMKQGRYALDEDAAPGEGA